MLLKWTSRSLSDLARLHAFLAEVNPAAAGRIVRSLTAASSGLLITPRIGERLNEFNPREVRRIIAGQYEMRYEVQNDALYILRIWHTREQR